MFAVLAGIPAAVGWTLFVGFTGIMSGALGGIVAVAIPFAVGFTYNKFKPKLNIVDRIIIVVLSVAMAFPSYYFAIMIWIRNYPQYDLWATMETNAFIPVIAGAIIAPIGNNAKKEEAE